MLRGMVRLSSIWGGGGLLRFVGVPTHTAHTITTAHTHTTASRTQHNTAHKGNTQHTNFHTLTRRRRGFGRRVFVVVFCVCTLCLAFLRCNRPLAGFPSHTFYTKYFACTHSLEEDGDSLAKSLCRRLKLSVYMHTKIKTR